MEHIQKIQVTLDQDTHQLSLLRMRQGDNGRAIEITIFGQGGMMVDFSGSAVVEFRASKPDGKKVRRTIGVSIESNTVTVAPEAVKNAINVVGPVHCEVVISEGGSTVGTAKFLIEVWAAAVRGDEGVSEDDMEAIGSLTQRAESAADRSEVAADNAESFSTHPPINLPSGNWGEWNGSEYVDTGNAWKGQDGVVQEIIAGDGISVDMNNPAKPIVSAIGDMAKGIYDPQGKNTDIFAYTDRIGTKVSYTPNLSTSEGQYAFPYIVRNGWYALVGDFCTYTFDIALSNFFALAATGIWKISSPLPPAAGTPSMPIFFSGEVTTYKDIGSAIYNGDSVSRMTTEGETIPLYVQHCGAGGIGFGGTIVYRWR